MATMPTPDPTQTPTPSAPANAQTQTPDPTQPNTPQTTPSASATPDASSQMVSNSGPTKPQPQSVQPQSAQPQSDGGLQPSTSSTNATIPTQPTKPLPAISPLQPDAQHPAVQRASLLHNIATALAGGPRFTQSIDPNTGATTRTQVPLSRSDIGMAIVSEALSGAFSGLSVKPGPGNIGRAAGAGFAQVQDQMQQADQQNQDQAQQQFKNEVQSKNQAAANLESASRTVLLNAQAEKEGLDNSKMLIDMDADARQNAEDNGDVQETGVSQADLLAGQKSGKYDPTRQAFYHDGVTTLNGHPEATFTVASNPNRPATLTQEQYDKYADAGIAGFTPGVKVPAAGSQVRQNMLDNWNRQVATQSVMKQEASDVVTHLANSPAYKDQSQAVSSNLAKAWADPVFKRAMTTALPSVSHSHPDEPLADAVARLGAAQVPDPNNPGKFVPNSAARIAASLTIYGGFGGGDPAKGKQFLQDEKDATAPTPIKTLGQADGIIADPTSSPKAKADAQAAKVLLTQDKAAGKAAKSASGTGAGAADSSLVDAIVSGHIVPDRLAYLMSKNPTLLSQVMDKDRNFDVSKAQSYPATYKDFTSGKTSQQITSGGVALQHLHQLQQINDANPTEVRLPGTKSNKAYNNLLDTVSDELVTFYGEPKTNEAIASKKSSLGGLANRDAAIQEQAKAMGVKLDELEQRWKNAAPSPAYEAPMPGVSDKAKAARAALDPDYAANQGTQGSGSGSQGQQSRTAPQQPRQLQIPAGAQIGRDAHGNVVGYKLPNGQFVPVGAK